MAISCSRALAQHDKMGFLHMRKDRNSHAEVVVSLQSSHAYNDDVCTILVTKDASDVTVKISSGISRVCTRQ